MQCFLRLLCIYDHLKLLKPRADGEIVCAKRVLVDGNENPFRHVIIPISRTSKMLSHAVAAFAAQDMRNQRSIHNMKLYDHALCYHKGKALTFLRQQCNKVQELHNVQERDAILLTISLLCHLEVSSGSKHEWFNHLKGSSSIIKFMHSVHGSRAFSSETLHFVYGFLYTLMDFSVGKMWHKKDEEHTTRLLNDARSLLPNIIAHDPTSIDPSIGLSWELVDIIHTAIDLNHRMENADSSGQSEKIAEEAIKLQHRVQVLTQHYDRANDAHHIFATAEAYRQAAFIFIYHGLYGQWSHSAAIRDIHLPLLVKSLEEIAQKQGSLLGTFPYPMWPIFIAASFADESQRATIMSIFAVMKTYRPVSNTHLTQKAVEAVWKGRDFNEESLLTVANRGRLGWQETLNRLGWILALN